MTTPVNQLSLSQAQETFFYDDADGNLYWKIKPNKRTNLGAVAGSDHPTGYKRVQIAGKMYKLHNLIWNFHFGKIPDGKEVDHIDRNNGNNKISNLRLATTRDQNLNMLHRGFSWHKDDKRWVATHRRLNAPRYRKRCRTALQARLAYEKEATTSHPSFVNSFFTKAIERLLSEPVSTA